MLRIRESRTPQGRYRGRRTCGRCASSSAQRPPRHSVVPIVSSNSAKPDVSNCKAEGTQSRRIVSHESSVEEHTYSVSAMFAVLGMITISLDSIVLRIEERNSACRDEEVDLTVGGVQALVVNDGWMADCSAPLTKIHRVLCPLSRHSLHPL